MNEKKLDSHSKIKAIHVCSDDLFGGAEAQLRLMIDRNDYQTMGIELGLVCFSEGDVYKHAKKNNISSYVANEKGSFFRLVKTTLSIFRDEKTNIIISHGYKEAMVSLLCTLLLNIKWVHVFHGVGEQHKGLKSWKLYFYKKIEQFFSSIFSNALVFVSKDTQTQLGFLKSTKARIIHNAAAPATKTKLTESINKHKVIWIGRLVEVKRPDLAVSTYEELQNIYKNTTPTIPLEFHIVGDGPLRSAIESQISKSRIKPHTFTPGFLSDLTEIYRDASLLLISSDSEGLPTVALEACHRGIPILARDVGGISEIKSKLPNYPIVLTKDSTPETLAKLALESLNNKTTANDLNSEYFLPKRMNNEYATLFQSLVK